MMTNVDSSRRAPAAAGAEAAPSPRARRRVSKRLLALEAASAASAAVAGSSVALLVTGWDVDWIVTGGMSACCWLLSTRQRRSMRAAQLRRAQRAAARGAAKKQTRQPQPGAGAAPNSRVEPAVAAANAAVTVVMPAFNEELRLPEAIASLRRQHYRYWRCVVVDDGSTDATAAVAVRLAAEDPRISVLSLRTNSGLPAARNAGLLQVETPYVLFLDADDILMPGALESRVASLSSKPDATGVFGKAMQVPLDAPWRSFRITPAPGGPAHVSLLSSHGENPFGVHEVLVRTKAIRELGGFDERLRDGGEDADLWIRSLRSGHEYVATGKVDCLYRQGASSMVSTGTIRHMQAVTDLIQRAWTGAASGPEVESPRAQAGDLGDIQRRAAIQRRLLRYLGMVQVTGPADAVTSVQHELATHGVLLLSDQQTRSAIRAGVVRSYQRRGVADDALVAEAVTAALQAVTLLSPTREEGPLTPQRDHPSWALLVEDAAQAHLVISTLGEVADDRLPAIILSEAVDADQGAGARFARDARRWTVHSLSTYLLRGIAYDLVVLPAPPSWVARLVAARVTKRAGCLALLRLPWTHDVTIDDEEARSRGVGDLGVEADVIKVHDLTGLAARHARRAVRRVRDDHPAPRLPVEMSKHGALGDYVGLRRPSVEALMALKDKHVGQRCVIIGNGPSLNRTDLSLLRGVPTFGVNGIYYAADRLPQPLTYYVVEDTKVFDENTDDVLAFGRECGTMLLPTLYQAKCPEPDGIVFFRMNGGFYNADGPNFARPRFSTNAAEVLYCGQSVTIINLQLAYWMGFSEVALIGMDFSYTVPSDTNVNGIHYTSAGDDPNHFDPRYFGAGKTWKDPKLHRVRANYALAKAMYEASGRRIVNATVGGQLDLFDRVALDDFVLTEQPALPAELSAS